MSERIPIVPGIWRDQSGTVTVENELGKLLFDLALALEDQSPHPVDVEHVLAAIVLAAQEGKLDAGRPLALDDQNLLTLLGSKLTIVFAKYGEHLGSEE